MRFEIQTMASNPIDSLERGMIDLLLTVDFAMSSDHPREFLFQDDHVVVGDAGNPALSGPISADSYFALGHVTTRFGRSRIPVFEDWFLKRHKRARRVEVVAPTFLSLPGLLVGTSRVATMHRKLAERVCTHMPLKMVDVPFDIPPIREAIQWHVASRNDFAIQWVIGQLRTKALEMYGSDGDKADNGEDGKLALEFQTSRDSLNG